MLLAEFVAFVEAQVYDTYVLGYEVPESKWTLPDPSSVWDCSELVQVAYGRFGVSISDGAWLQYNATVPVTDAPRPGDLVFLRNNPSRPNGIGHVGIVVDPVTVVEAKGKAYGVVRTSLEVWKNKSAYAGMRRYPPFTAAMKEAEPVGYIVLREGMTNSLVGELQERLRKTGAAVIPSNNYFDARTTQLVKNFQTSALLEADGIVGPNTWTKLIAVTADVPVAVNVPDSTLAAKAARYDVMVAIMNEPL